MTTRPLPPFPRNGVTTIRLLMQPPCVELTPPWGGPAEA